MDLTAFRTAVYRRLGVPTTDTGYTTTDIDEYINAALQQFALENDWSWCESTDTGSTVAGTATITPAATTRKVRAVVVNNVQYRRVSLEDMLDDDSDTSTSTYRGTFSERAGVVILRPVPGSVVAYTLEVIRYETTLSAGTDTPLAPTQYHATIADLATALACPRFNRLDQLDSYMKLYAKGLARIMAAEVRVGGKPITPRVRRGAPL